MGTQFGSFFNVFQSNLTISAFELFNKIMLNFIFSKNSNISMIDCLFKNNVFLQNDNNPSFKISNDENTTNVNFIGQNITFLENVFSDSGFEITGGIFNIDFINVHIVLNINFSLSMSYILNSSIMFEKEIIFINNTLGQINNLNIINKIQLIFGRSTTLIVISKYFQFINKFQCYFAFSKK